MGKEVEGAWRLRCHLVLATLWRNIVRGVNYHENSFEHQKRTTTTNCRISFIDLYVVFPTNFRIVFLPHINTVILLEQSLGYQWFTQFLQGGGKGVGADGDCLMERGSNWRKWVICNSITDKLSEG